MKLKNHQTSFPQINYFLLQQLRMASKPLINLKQGTSAIVNTKVASYTNSD